jgi:hypothetical protein
MFSYEQLRQLLLGAVLPGAISLVLFVVAWRAWQRRGSVNGTTPRGSWAGVIAMVLSYAMAVWATTGIKPWLPVAVQDRLVYVAFAVSSVALLDALVRLPWYLRGGSLVVVAVGAAWVLMDPLLAQDAVRRDAIIGLVSMAGLIVLVTSSLDWSSRKMPGPAVLLATYVWLACVATFIATSGSASLGQWVGGLAAAALAGAIVAFRARHGSLAYGGALAAVTLAIATLGCAYYYGTADQPARALPVALAPVLGVAGTFPGVRGLRPLWRGLIVILLVLIPCGVVAGISAVEFVRSQSVSDESMYY